MEEQVPLEPLLPKSPAWDVHAIRFLLSDHTTSHHLLPSGITMTGGEDATASALPVQTLLAWDLLLGII